MTVNDHLIVHEPDHGQRAVERLLSQHELPRWEAFLRAIGCGVQAIENTGFAVIATATVLEIAPLDALRKWAGIVGESQGDLTRDQLLQIVLQRIVTNSAGRQGADRNRALESFTRFLVDVFAPSEVSVSVQDSVIVVSVISPTLGTIGVRAGAMVGLWRPIGTLVVVLETVAATGARYSTAGRGYGSVYGRRLYNGG